MFAQPGGNHDALLAADSILSQIGATAVAKDVAIAPSRPSGVQTKRKQMSAAQQTYWHGGAADGVVFACHGVPHATA